MPYVRQINMHSFVDLITNSSTSIYTDYSGSVEAAKELIREITNIYGVDINVDKDIKIFTLMDLWEYFNYIESMPEDYPIDQEEAKRQYDDVKAGLIDKPEWMETAEDQSDHYEGIDNELFIVVANPNAEKFSGIFKKMLDFISSPTSDASYEG